MATAGGCSLAGEAAVHFHGTWTDRNVGHSFSPPVSGTENREAENGQTGMKTT